MTKVYVLVSLSDRLRESKRGHGYYLSSEKAQQHADRLNHWETVRPRYAWEPLRHPQWTVKSIE